MGKENKEGGEEERGRTNKSRHSRDRLIQNNQEKSNQKNQVEKLNLSERHRGKMQKKKRWMLTRLTVVIISQYIQTLNYYVIYLKLT